MANIKAYFNMANDDKPQAELLFSHWQLVLQRQQKNACALSPGENKSLWFCFHRIIPGFMGQGVAFMCHNGTGFILKHAGPGISSAVNAESNTSGSWFFILVTNINCLFGKPVAFGQVKEGMKVVEVMEHFGSWLDNKRIFISQSIVGYPMFVLRFVTLLSDIQATDHLEVLGTRAPRQMPNRNN
ncbi:peptidyl-prolyl cis-trans isomerase A-like [Dromiciops gliroides]|uniref:peptidyl-prolyl cis-trans isomerase A-like n=1 Tax=Dromiciops gliroides TaxID=33562 RepID=UPI001CC42D74|nr:peptidyl-prolyl cis-trans isomerase A-like [Dromiciops gliroides]